MTKKSVVIKGKVPLIASKNANFEFRKPRGRPLEFALDANRRPKPFNFTLKDGRVVRVRRWGRHEKPAEARRFINDLVRDHSFLTVDEVQTLAAEKTYVKSVFEKIRTGQSVHWLAVDSRGGWAANMHAERGRFRDRDVVAMGVSVHPDFQGHGLGEAVLRTTIADALATLKPRILCLTVVGGNQRAQKLYRKVGFREVSRRKGWHKFRHGLEDEVTMVYGRTSRRGTDA